MPRLTHWIYDATQPDALAGLDYFKVFGYHSIHSAYPVGYHQHDNVYEFAFIEKGKATWEVDGILYPTNAGDVFYTRPSEVHRARYNALEPCQLWWFDIEAPNFSASHASEWLLTSHEEALAIIHQLDTLPRVLHIGLPFAKHFHQLQQTIERRDSMCNLRTRLQILNVLFMITDHAEKYSARPDIADFKQRLRNQQSADWSWRPTIEEIAEQFGYSASHFHKLFREQVGLSPMSYLERSRMEHACRLLEQTETSITSIAIQLGYTSSQHFATMFRRYIGYTPSSWRTKYAPLSEKE